MFSIEFCPQLLAHIHPRTAGQHVCRRTVRHLQISFRSMPQSLHPFLYEEYFQQSELVILSAAVHFSRSCRSKVWLIWRENDHVQRTCSQAWSPDRISSHSQSFRRTLAGTCYKYQPLLCIGLITDVFSEPRTAKSSALLIDEKCQRNSASPSTIKEVCLGVVLLVEVINPIAQPLWPSISLQKRYELVCLFLKCSLSSGVAGPVSS